VLVLQFEKHKSNVMKKKIILALCAIFLTACGASDDSSGCHDGGNGQVISVAFIGNSLTRNLPLKVIDLLACGGFTPAVAVNNPSSTSLSDHIDDDKSLQLIAKGFDHIVLQEHSSGMHALHVAPYALIQQFKDLIEANGSDMMFYQTWGYRGEDRLAHINGYDQVGNYFGSRVVAVGRAWSYFEANYGSQFNVDLFDDDRHASFQGQVLTAYTFYAYLTGESPQGLLDFGLTGPLAEALQISAWTTYQSYQ